MNLPFTHDQFLDLFAAYNRHHLPFILVLWVTTAFVAAHWLGRRPLDARTAFGVLAVHWAWSGLAYHWSYFRAINPAAAIFAALFVVQACVFAWLTVRRGSHFTALRSARGVIGAALVLYGLAYPFVGMAFGLQFPRMPLFAVPCPTTLVTAGFLVGVGGVPRFVNVIPILWTIVAGSAAFTLGITADVALFLAGAVLALDAIAPSVLGPKVKGEPAQAESL